MPEAPRPQGPSELPQLLCSPSHPGGSPASVRRARASQSRALGTGVAALRSRARGVVLVVCVYKADISGAI